MMDLFIFTCDVRTRGDAILQSLNSDCQRPLTALECRSVAETVVRECCIEPDWKNIPDEAVRIVATKAADMSNMEDLLKGKETRSFRAIDDVQNGADWQRATERVTLTLNRNVYEYELCKLYVGAVALTFNFRQNGETVFSQGQVAVAVHLPDESIEFVHQRLRLRLASPGKILFLNLSSCINLTRN